MLFSFASSSASPPLDVTSFLQGVFLVGKVVAQPHRLLT